PARLWKLTPRQYSRTVQAILGASAANAGDALADTVPVRTSGFTNADATLDISPEHLDALYNNAEQLAAAIVADPKAFPCGDPMKVGTPSCIRPFLQSLTAKAFRRNAKVDQPDVYSYLGFWSQLSQDLVKGDDALEPVRLTVMAVLLSPKFLFRTELG